MQSAKYPEGGGVGPQDTSAVRLLTRKVHRPLEHRIVLLVVWAEEESCPHRRTSKGKKKKKNFLYYDIYLWSGQKMLFAQYVLEPLCQVQWILVTHKV